MRTATTTTTLADKKLVKYTEALQLINVHAGSFGRERIALDDADGRVLAESVFADRDYPPFNRAAMDGFAFRSSDWESGRRDYRIQETLYAGQINEAELAPGACYKVMTGAAVPPWADVLVHREEALEYGMGTLLLPDKIKPYQNIVQKGEDIRSNEIVVPAQTACDPSLIGLLAGVGKKTLMVERMPRVALFTTGNEIVPVKEAVSGAQVRNSNKHLLLALLRKWKIRPDVCEHLPDNKTVLTAALQKVLSHDIVILNGGVSSGDAEMVPQVLKKLGVEQVFHQVAIKPGKEIYFGKLPKGGVVFALPGNPFSCLVTFTLFVEEFLYSSFGLMQPVYQSTLLEQREKSHSLTEFFPVRIDAISSGVRPFSINGAGDIRAGVGAHALGVHLAGHQVMKRGTVINLIPLNTTLL
jgi:molybdopterin molybdotransferase